LSDTLCSHWLLAVCAIFVFKFPGYLEVSSEIISYSAPTTFFVIATEAQRKEAISMKYLTQNSLNNK